MRAFAVIACWLCLASVTWGAAVQEAAPLKARPFELKDVRLLDGPFKHAQDLQRQWLLALEPDRLLAWFHKEAGLEPKAPVYGGWESRGVAGHCLGHYLSGCSLLYQSTGDEEFRRRVEYIVRALALCQEANGNGYVAAIPGGKTVFEEVSRGEIRSAGFDLNGSWVPLYTMHKLFAGLIDAFTMKVLPVEQMQLVCTYWGSDAGGRIFDVLIEGEKVATQRLENNRPGTFYDEPYEIPASLTRDKSQVTVTFQAHPRRMAGGLYGARMIKAEF